jgi:RNA polymerase sigma-70 factor (ECF subfamily)
MKAMPSSHDRTKDADWIDAARAGSLDALGELYRRHADDVHALAYRVTLSRDDAADVLQELFVGLPRALHAYREHGRFESWLKQVTVRMCLMHMRRKRRKREDSLDDRALLPHSVTTPDPLDRIALGRALATLPGQLRAVFVLKEIEGYTHVEIAELLQISSANSATRLSRAWAILRKELRP